MIKLQGNGSIFYGQNPGAPEWGENACEIVGVFSGPDPHVGVQWPDGTLSIKDMDAVGEAGIPIPCKGGPWGRQYVGKSRQSENMPFGRAGT